MQYYGGYGILFAVMNLPIDYINRMKEDLGENFEKFIDTYDERAYKGLRVNTLKNSVERFFEVNPWNIGVKDGIAWCPEGFYFEEKDSDAVLPQGKHPYHAAGVYYIQEPSAMSAVMQLHVKPGDFVLDLCASPGGKSTQIASLLKNEGILVCNEPYAQRAKILSENIERMGIANALVISHEPQELSDRFEESFNKVLVDAPCSGEGMFRKNPEAVEEWSLDNVCLCAKRQKEILTQAYRMLSPGGRLVYSTCTFSKSENEENAHWFEDTFEDIRLIQMKRIWPHEECAEGHFVAVFEKDGEETYGFTQKIRSEKLKTLQDAALFEEENLNTDYFKRVGEDICMVRFGDELYAVPSYFPAVEKLRVLRLGLHLGTLKKNRFEPSLSLALALSPEDSKKSVSVNYEEALAYLRGQTLVKDAPKGWVLLDIDGYTLSFGKAGDGVIKNHYPKGLRING